MFLELLPSIEESQIQAMKKNIKKMWVLRSKKNMQAFMKLKQKSKFCLVIIMIKHW